MIDITEGKANCEAVWEPAHNVSWACMLDEGHAAADCLVVARSAVEDRRREVLRSRELDALRAEVAALRARGAA